VSLPDFECGVDFVNRRLHDLERRRILVLRAAGRCAYPQRREQHCSDNDFPIVHVKSLMWQKGSEQATRSRLCFQPASDKAQPTYHARGIVGDL
jgi:hypothetical protein